MEVKENGDMEPDQVEPIVMQRGDERSFDHHGHHDRLFCHAEFIWHAEAYVILVKRTSREVQ